MKFASIGILGGGQLGRMLAQAAQRLGMRVSVLDPDPDAPAGQVAQRHVAGSFRDPDKIKELAQGCDVVTIEIEHVDAEALEMLEQVGVNVQPTAHTIRLIQDKFAQKQFLAERHIPLPAFREISDAASASQAGEAFGYPFMMKARRLAYDGRGNYVVRSPDDIPVALAALGTNELYTEQWVPFDRELAVMVARSADGQIAIYPVVETVQIDNICHTVIAPAQIASASARTASEIARAAVSSLEGAGIFGVELFLLPDGSVLLNEIAPRPHNSGHYTIEACVTSQFEQHIRAITGLSLGDPSVRVPAAVMVNLIGRDTVQATEAMVDQARTIEGASFHWYGKRDLRPGRKLGHITLTGESLPDIARRITPFTSLKIAPRPVVGIIMGSDSDLPVMKQAADILRDFDVPFELTIVSAHRTPDRMFEYARTAVERGLRVIIAGAGGAAHLPGMVAALTPLPVIGVPIRIEPLDGQDALFSIVQMPRGVPVATVAIGNATNAGLLAVRILGSQQSALLQRMLAYQDSLKVSVMKKVAALEAEKPLPGDKSPG